jgi:hypothetical protein
MVFMDEGLFVAVSLSILREFKDAALNVNNHILPRATFTTALKAGFGRQRRSNSMG